MKVTLDDADLEDSCNIAVLRNEIKNLHNVQTKRYTQNLTDLDSHILGVVAERVVARMLGVDIDRRVTIGGDDGYDLRLGPLTVQVKYRTKQGWSFACDGFLDADIGVLVYPSEQDDTFIVAGWTTRTHFASNFKIADYGYGVRFVIEQEDMFDAGKLVEFARVVKEKWLDGQIESGSTDYK